MSIEDCFEDMTEWVKEHPGTVDFVCEFCGIYTASKSRCNCCEPEDPEKVKKCPQCNSFFEIGKGSEQNPDFCSDKCVQKQTQRDQEISEWF